MKKIPSKYLEIALLLILTIVIILFLLFKKSKSNKKITLTSTLTSCPPGYVQFLGKCILPAPVAPVRCNFCTIYNSSTRSCEPLVCPSGSFCIPQGASYKCSKSN